MEPAWILLEVILAIHEAQLAEHGGVSGLRDVALLESALARPQNTYLYEQRVTLNLLASVYAIGLAKNHAFVDGNKRTAWVACALFLLLNGVQPVSNPAQAVQMMLHAAAGEVSVWTCPLF